MAPRTTVAYGKGPARWLAALVLLMTAAAAGSLKAEDVDNVYRFSVFPWYKLSDKFTLYAHLDYSFNPDERSQIFNFVSPGLYYTARPWLQIWGGMINRYLDNNPNQADELELRPFVGVKLFVPNDWKINFYNFFRFEHRAIENLDTHEWQGVNRIRSRFGAEIPLTATERAWSPTTWYALVNVEPFYTFDQHAITPLRVSGGIGYVLSEHVQIELSYQAQFERSNGSPLAFTENTFRLNVKIGLNRERTRPEPTPTF